MDNKRRLLALFVIQLVGVFLGFTEGQAVGLTNVPLDDPAYQDLQKLLAQVGKTHNFATLPISRLEVAEILIELSAAGLIQDADSPLTKSLYERLSKRFSEEISYLQEKRRPDKFDVRFDPMETIEADCGYQRSEEDFLKQFAYGEKPYWERQGINTFDEHFQLPQLNSHHGFVSKIFFDFSLDLEDHLAFFLRPQFKSASDFSGEFTENDMQNADLDGLYLKTQIVNIALEAGRDNLWWGVGHYGTLLLSNNAPPLDLIKLQSNQPFYLPWFFKYLGPTTLNLMLTRLEGDRVVPHPYVLGLRGTIMPLERMEMGLTRTVQFGGERREQNSFANFGDILIGRSEHTYGSSSDTNQLAMFDARLTLPETRLIWKQFRQIQLWFEYGTETVDWNTYNGLRVPVPAAPSTIYGASLDFGVIEMLGEFVDTFNRAQWYKSFTYKDGYTYRGECLGHPYEKWSLSFDGRLRWYVTPAWQVSLLPAFHRWRSKKLELEQRDMGAGAEVEWTSSFALNLRFGGRFWLQEKMGVRPVELEEEFNRGAEAWFHISQNF